ncbi:MAG TPA: PfkB family carbohydrate kinase [Blastocatellia bacterium]|nr:PfkB family carbohydrate kinase [Blastocatellia bacterium]
MDKITILEFAPCADSIHHLRRDREEGYVASDGGNVTIRSGSRLRPRMVSTYAGGKATNVARVIEKLLRLEDRVEVELIVFRPDSPEGRYIHDLQTSALRRVQVRPVIIEGSARLCIDLSDPESGRDDRVEFNISPRAFWGAGALEIALERMSQLSTGLLLLAGNPPVMETTGEMAVDLYARVMEIVRPHVSIISVDTEKGALARCLAAQLPPDVIKINRDEYASVASPLWDGYTGTLLVTDAEGCTIREEGETRVQGAQVAKLYSTIGAGDAVHAGFTLARWVWGFDAVRAARYGQAAAAATVSAPDGTRGVTRQVVERWFAELERGE